MHSIGPLVAGDQQMLAIKKKEYWNAYKRKWKREKRKRSKTVEIFLPIDAYHVIEKKATKMQMSVPAYMKHSAMYGEHLSPKLIGKARACMMAHMTALEETIEQTCTEEIHQKLVHHIVFMEQEIMQVLTNAS